MEMRLEARQNRHFTQTYQQQMSISLPRFTHENVHHYDQQVFVYIREGTTFDFMHLLWYMIHENFDKFYLYLGD